MPSTVQVFYCSLLSLGGKRESLLWLSETSVFTMGLRSALQRGAEALGIAGPHSGLTLGLEGEDKNDKNWFY